MPTLPNYKHFAGHHWETGTVHNALAYQGAKVPQTKKPLSEAMLLGLSGGVAFGYFTFEYKGYDPHLALLSRNMFDPLETLLERLAVPIELLQTNDAKKAEKNLTEVLESGRVPIVTADMYGLPYNNLPFDKAWWGAAPIIVYGYENGVAHIADRSSQPLTVTAEELAQARARIKDVKFRIRVLDTPNWTKLPAAIQKGIWQCISLYTEAPPKGARHNFGLAAYQHWAEMLTNTRNKQSWERFFAAGSRMHAALIGGGGQPGAFGWARTAPANMVDDRALYAQFLEEAALILSRPKLKAAGKKFAASSAAWREFSNALLPDDVPAFKEARELRLQNRELFITQGSAALPELKRIEGRLRELKAAAKENFPMSDSAVANFRETLRTQVLKIHDLEKEAVELLQEAMG